MNLIDKNDLRLALAELMRVTRKRIIFSLRTYRKNPERHYHQPHSLMTIISYLTGSWKIGKANPIGGDNTYRIVTLCNG